MSVRMRWNPKTREWREYDPKAHLSPRVYVIQDTQDAVLSPADGQVYESKSAMRQAAKALGCVELGNDYAHAARPPSERSYVDERSLDADLHKAAQYIEQRHGRDAFNKIFGD